VELFDKKVHNLTKTNILGAVEKLISAGVVESYDDLKARFFHLKKNLFIKTLGWYSKNRAPDSPINQRLMVNIDGLLKSDELKCKFFKDCYGQIILFYILFPSFFQGRLCRENGCRTRMGPSSHKRSRVRFVRRNFLKENNYLSIF
jgi:hypothetical protein